MARIKPGSVIGLLLTVALLFGFQGQVTIAQPGLIAVPIILQSCAIFALGYAWACGQRWPHKVAATCARIGTSNFFELAVMGVLVEVPVMRSRVAFANRTRDRVPK